MQLSSTWHKSLISISALLLLLFTTSSHANTLEVAPSAPWFFHLGAAILLYAHIGGGAIGILSGVVASLSRKGSQTHRTAGKLFLVSMFICYMIGALVSPFLTSQQSTNFIAAILALYLLISGVSSARRGHFVADIREKVGLAIGLFITSVGVIFMYLANQSPDGSMDGSPPQAYVLFVVAGALSSMGELKVIIRKKLSNKERTIRHLWRMCMSFFIASGSLFFGQVQFFPEWFNESIPQLALGFFPLAIMVIYVSKVTLFKRPHRHT